MTDVKIYLQWIDPNTEKTYQYEGSLPVTIGRESGNTIVLNSNRVSRNHARLEQQGEQILLSDLGSSNGTGVGNKYMHEDTVALENNSEFTIDPFVFLLSLVEVEEPAPNSPKIEPFKTLAVRLPPPLNTLSDKEAVVIDGHSHRVSFAAGEYLFHQGDEGTGCYLIDSGLVRIELDHEVSDPDDNEVLTFIEPHTVLGEMSLLDNFPRSASAIAHTDVKARLISNEVVELLTQEHPTIAMSFFMALGRSASEKLRDTTSRLDNLMGLKSDPRVEDMIAKAEAAQQEFLAWSEEQVDALLLDIAQAVDERALELAEEAVAETRIGHVPDKVVKNKVASMGVYQSLMGQQGYGNITGEGSILDIASPVGIVFGLVPVTNPTSTFVFKTLIALKSRNALILSPNRRAVQVSNHMGEIIQEILKNHKAPADIVQWIDSRATRKLTITFMNHKKVGLILATGGPSMVKAAYSSGNPAIGVGSGNAPVYVAADADLGHAAQSIVMSKSFDNGLICGSEHNLVVNQLVQKAFVDALEQQGAAVLSRDEAAALYTNMIDERTNGFVEAIIGQNAASIAEQLDIMRDYPIRLIVAPVDAISPQDAFSREKMTPILSLFTVEDDAQALETCLQLLDIDGSGHTAIIHARDEGLIERFGLTMPASRILVNSPGAHGVVGITTDLIPSLTLGCGTFGGNSTTDNVSFKNLMNIKRMAYFTPERLALLQEM